MKVRRGLKIALIAVCGLSVIAVSLFSGWQKIFVSLGLYADRARGVSVSFIDVGKADAAFITCGDYRVLIDSGEDSEAQSVYSYLKRYGVDTLDLAVATHPDKDHIGGMSRIIDEFEVKRFWSPALSEDLIPETSAYKNMLASLDRKNISADYAGKGEKAVFGDMTFTVLSPGKIYDSANNNSLVIRLDCCGRSFLFTGDAEQEVERDLIAACPKELNADVLKISHHGSNNGSCAEFLSLVSPEYAVLSVGDNTNNLPNKACLERVEAAGARLYRTDLQGTVTLNCLENGDITVHTEI